MTREQDPIYAAEMHLIRRFGGGRWASLEANFYNGGRTTVDGMPKEDLQRNSTIGGSLVWPIGSQQSLRLGLSTGVATESGGDYRSVLISYIRVLR
ncbi:MAG: hypothetical protein HC808_05430 [Candidatus Competibacteraceae bacterium]|nr:hypothetical protein [Candidatus Competibacteraceae bacterium]